PITSAQIQNTSNFQLCNGRDHKVRFIFHSKQMKIKRAVRFAPAAPLSPNPNTGGSLMYTPTETRSWQRLCLYLLSILLLSFSSALAQTTSTTILGTVSDSAGAVVAGAKII